MGIEGDVKMNLNIGQVIYELRKQKNITQEQLANILGVSIPAVSKWENGTTYPDITLLPIIARYFNVTMDELMDYQMELSSEEITKFIKECQVLMQTDSFEIIVKKCQYHLKQYPNSDELKLSIGSLYMMGLSYITDENFLKDTIQQAITLLESSAKSSDHAIRDQSHFILASLYGMNDQEDKAEDVLLKLPKSEFNRDDLLIPIYIRQNRYEEAEQMIQVNLFKSLQAINHYLSNYQTIAIKNDNLSFAKKLLKMEDEMIRSFGVQSFFGMGHLMGAMNFYATLEDEEEMMHYLLQLVETIENCDEQEEAPLFEKMNFKQNYTKQHGANILLNLLTIDPKLECLKTHPIYPQVIERLKRIE